MQNMGFISVIPSLLAVVLCFVTRNTVVSLMVACFAGTLLAGQGLMGLPTLLKTSMGTTGFAWVMMLNVFISILVAYFQKTGAIQGFSRKVHDFHLGRKGVQLISWLLGLFVYFSDSFSPLFVGTVMRRISDNAKISREKLSYIADSTSAPVSVLVPITGWAAYLSGLAVGVGCIVDQEQAMSLFVKAVPFNFYALFAVAFVFLIGSGLVKDFGPMKKAERRAMDEGKVLRDGAQPLIGKELTEMPAQEGIKTRVFLNFILPVLMIVCIAVGTYVTLHSAKTMEAFLAVVIFMTVSMMLQGIPLKDVINTATDGVKGAVPVVMLLALAYSVNALSKTMGTATYIVSLAQQFLSPHLLPFIIFVIAAIMAFATGTSWGTFAICMPIALPLAFNYTNNQVTPLVTACFAAVAGGGVFGDHCSPLSDTTVLSSAGAAADHIDHVKTQLPYALVCAAAASIAYLFVGFLMV